MCVLHFNKGCLASSCTGDSLTVILTWLGVSVVHCVSIQLEELHRLRLLLSVAAHGKGVLTHLWQEQGDRYLFIQ